MKRFLVFLCLFILNISLSHSAVVIDIVETGGDVQATLSGRINLSAVSNNIGPSFSTNHYLAASGLVGFSTGAINVFSISASTWTPFGATGIGFWDSWSGDDFLLSANPYLGLPSGYISQSTLSATATKNSSSFAALGFTPGSYVTTLTNGAFTDTVTVNIGSTPTPTYSVGGTVSGRGNDFILLNNGGDALTIISDGSFTFDTALPEGDLYAVSVDTSSLDPSDSCSVTNGNGTIGTADVTSVAVTCERVFQLGGIISGVTSGGSITLQNNGGDDLTWNDDPITSYRFPTRLAQGATYNVTVLTPPTGQTCTVANATGTMSNSNFVDVNVTCEDDVVPPVEPPPPATSIPTTSQWALIMLSMLLGLMVFANRRRLF